MSERRTKVEAIRKVYPKGTKVKLISMADPYPIKEGTVGTVESIDDVGTIFVKWEDGRSLGLIYGEDDFVRI